MRMGMTVVASLVVGVLSLPVRANPEDARKLLELSAGAIGDLQTLTANVEVGATGGFSDYLPSIKGKLVVARMPPEENERAARNPFEFRFTGSGRTSAKLDEVEFDAIYRERRYEWMADEEKEQRIRFDRVAFRDREIKLAKELFLEDVFTAEPFATQLRADSLEMVEGKTIGGVSCDAVKVPVGTGGRYQIFYIPRSDFIPRRIEQGTDAEGLAIDGLMFKELRDVRVNEGLAEGSFEMPIPEGYQPDPNPARMRPPVAQNPQGVAPQAQPRRPLASPFELSDAEGNTVSLSDLRGKVVVLDFWATWLTENARQSMGVMQALSEHFADEPVVFYGLNFRERDPERAMAFFREGGYTYNVLLDADEVQGRYGVRQFPTMYIIGMDGEVVEVVQGYKEETTLSGMIETIEKYLAEREGKAPVEGTGGAASGTATGGG